MTNKEPLIIIAILCLIMGAAFGVGVGILISQDSFGTEAQLNCIYTNRLVFGEQVFDCRHLPGVTVK